jgi:hypothetical protein
MGYQGAQHVCLGDVLNKALTTTDISGGTAKDMHPIAPRRPKTSEFALLHAPRSTRLDEISLRPAAHIGVVGFGPFNPPGWYTQRPSAGQPLRPFFFKRCPYGRDTGTAGHPPAPAGGAQSACNPPPRTRARPATSGAARSCSVTAPAFEGGWCMHILHRAYLDRGGARRPQGATARWRRRVSNNGAYAAGGRWPGQNTRLHRLGRGKPRRAQARLQITF